VQLVLSPLLLGISGEPASQWLQKVQAWWSFAREHNLRFLVPQDYPNAAASDQCLSDYLAIKNLLESAEIAGASLPEVIQLYSALISLTDEVRSEMVRTSAESTGCIQRLGCPTLRDEVLLTIASLPDGSICVGTLEAEREDVHVRWMVENGGVVEDGETWSTTICAPLPHDALLASPFAADARPTLALAMASAKLPPSLQTAISARVHFLPGYSSSLAGLDAQVIRSTYEAIAHLCLPPSDRPSGLDEHPLRSGPGAHDPQRESRWGRAWRVDIRQRGPGWRLHYWRGPSTLVISGVVPHNSFAILE
jgi:hypothetical protein